MFAGHGYFLFGLIRISSECSVHPENTLIVRGMEFEYNKEFGYYMCIMDPKGATVVFLHGNGRPACCWLYKDILKLILSIKGINIALVEYRGYGRLNRKRSSLSQLENIRTDIASQWSHISTRVNTSRLLLAGVSLGGGFAWSTVDRLSPPPAQLVLINTFANLGIFAEKLVAHLLTPTITPLLPCIVSSVILNYRIENFQSSWRGKVLCVQTQDDFMFPLSHLEIFRGHFLASRGYEFKEFICLSGGHNEGFTNYDGWLADLII
jgi:pimeloyl-ACP methyl ester carboxylesterase